MRILQICNKAPFPPQDGGCIAMNNLTQGLIAEGHTVKVLAVNTPKHFTEISALPEEYRRKTNIEAVFIDTSVKPLPALLNLFSSGSYNISRFYSQAFENRIIELLKAETYDIIQLESLYVTMYASAIRQHSGAKIVLRAHNIEHKLWERNAAAADNLAERLYFRFLAKRLKKYELQSFGSYDAVAAITAEDAQWFSANGYHRPLEVIPFGIDLAQIDANVKTGEEPFTAFHIGAMDWQPNVEGINWFIKNVWDLVHAAYPQLKFYLAGRKMSDELLQLNKPNVLVEGEVENAHDFIRSKGLMIVPLLSGGGMRVKIIEGMALGKIIVTTTLGAEGIAAENNKNIIIANSAGEFINAIGRYVADPAALAAIGTHAKQLAFEQYNNAAICKKLSLFYGRLVKNQ